MNRLRTALALLFIAGLFVTSMLAQGIPAPYTFRLQQFIPSGLDRPILFRDDGPGPGRRMFIVQQPGLIRLLQPGSRTPTDFLSLAGRVIPIGGLGDERGLLGMTVHPDFDTNGTFYVNYTRIGDGATVIAEYKTLPGNLNQGDFNSERILLTIPQPFSNHNGGMIEFGVTPTDRTFLYIGMGDGGSANDPGNRAQNRTLLLGKMLRIDPNIPVGSPVPYLIPPGNPFQGVNTTRCDSGSTTTGNTCQEIWAIGMRNPWRWSFDRTTGDLWVGDVGQGSREEIDLITGGANYGWRVFEGTLCTPNDPTFCTTPPPGVTYTPPIFDYSSASPAVRCSVTGGYVYRGTLGSLPPGSYVFSDFCTAEIMLWTGTPPFQVLQDPSGNIISFGQDENGELYACFGSSIVSLTRAKASADFDGDLRTDVSVFRPSTGVWYISHSSNSTIRIQAFGVDGDIPTSEDFDGDNISDIGVFRPSTGDWHFYRSSDNTAVITPFGINGDIPSAADYDGDAMADLAVFRPSTGTWWIRRSTDPNNFLVTQFGLNGDTPVAGDYDGDGKYDIAVWRGSTGVWYQINSSNGSVGAYQFGLNADIPTQADFDGDGRTDIAVFRPSSGVWYIVRSSSGAFQFTQWGTNGDVPVVGDYDGDGLDDIAVFRPSDGVWYRVNSSNGVNVFTQFGLTGDLAIPRYDAP